MFLSGKFLIDCVTCVKRSVTDVWKEVLRMGVLTLEVRLKTLPKHKTTGREAQVGVACKAQHTLRGEVFSAGVKIWLIYMTGIMKKSSIPKISSKIGRYIIPLKISEVFWKNSDVCRLFLEQYGNSLHRYSLYGSNYSGNGLILIWYKIWESIAYAADRTRHLSIR